MEALHDGYDPVKFDDWRAAHLAKICTCDFFNRRTKPQYKEYGGLVGLGYKVKRFGDEYDWSPQETMQFCERENTTVVPKTIRLYNIRELYRLPQFGCDNFKVIHLVRDPRAVMLSRMRVFHELYDGNKLLGKRVNGDQKVFSRDYMFRAASDMCANHLHNYNVAMSAPRWLAGKYRFVRYEDLAAQPHYQAESLVNFIGLEYDSIFREYVYNTTHVKARGVEDKGNYAVEKETKELINSWRSLLLKEHWLTIEQACSEMMATMGYKTEMLE